LHNEDLSELAKANIEALARPEKPTEPNFIGGDSGSGIWEEIKKENLTGTISRHENVKGATGRCEMKLMQNPESYNPYQYCLK
jgi:hypothetical protein